MTDRESKEGKERFGPIIERNERRTKRHSKRVDDRSEERW